MILQSKRSDRRGGALIEFAVCLPVLMLLILGSIEATSAVFLKESLNAAAYESIREAARTTSSTDSAKALGTAVLDARLVKNAAIVFEPADIRTAVRGSIVRVTVSAPIRGNSPFIGNVITDRVLQVQSFMIKE
ncbi:MAG: TadE/TadG family type IV pilus assembly protein [Pirellulales bacterium]